MSLVLREERAPGSLLRETSVGPDLLDYDMDYVITQEELESLAGNVKVLAALTKKLCEAEIAKYDSKT
ncbi:MAG: hypothetical protein MJA30_26825 [Cytophagales bacterium]|nr:hypothetical protein [Cytophagales bacterium]